MDGFIQLIKDYITMLNFFSTIWLYSITANSVSLYYMVTKLVLYLLKYCNFWATPNCNIYCICTCIAELCTVEGLQNNMYCRISNTVYLTRTL